MFCCMSGWVEVGDMVAVDVDTISLGGVAGIIWVTFNVSGATLGSLGVPDVVPGGVVRTDTLTSSSS
jgi:hypothetical protein